MAGNPLRGEVEITLDDDRTYTLRFNNNSIAELEQMLGGGAIMTKFAGKTQDDVLATMMSIHFCRAAVYCGMKERGYKKITPRLVGTLMASEADKMAEYSNQILRGLLAWYGKNLDDQAAEAQKSAEEIEAPDDLEKKVDPKPSSTTTAAPNGGPSLLPQTPAESAPASSGS